MSKNASRGLDLHNLQIAMRRKGLDGPTDLARVMGMAHASTAHHWIKGETTPDGINLGKLASVLGVSNAFLFGATQTKGGERGALVQALREELGSDLDSPEADLVEAMGGLSKEQRRTLANLVLAMIPQIQQTASFTPPSKPPKAPEPSTDSGSAHRRKAR